jgi:putative peptidoglycan lipid II flippase
VTTESPRSPADPEDLAEVVEPGAMGGLDGMDGVSSNDAGVLRSTSVMAAGTIVSRLTGVLRTTALAAAIGSLGVLADAYNTANTLPNIIYIMLVGGALNAVFIPQLVRHMKDDPDGGTSYADRLLTLSAVTLLFITAVAVIAAPWISRLYAGSQYSPRQLEVLTAFAYLCLPQILFYGLYALYSQVLNARGHFAAPMFAPIINNVVVIAGCVAFIAVTHKPSIDTITGGQIALLGTATTLGVVLQAVVLTPVMARSGYRFRPRFDLRGQGLGTAIGLAKWTIFFVMVNQVAYLIITRLANNAGAIAESQGTKGAGSTAYANAHLMFILPHSIITVSVITALMPRMSRAAHAGNLAAVRHDLARGMRMVSAVMVPSAILLALLGPRIAILLLGYGNTSDPGARLVGNVLQAFSVGVVAYSLYYVLLRGFFAMEDTKTPALVNIFLNIVNIAVGYAFYRALPADKAVAGLALGYAVAYIATTVVLWLILRPRVGGLDTYVTVRTLVRLTLAGAVAAILGTVTVVLLGRVTGQGKLGALLVVVVVSLVVATSFAAAARRLRVTEMQEALDIVSSRIKLPRLKKRA